MNLKEHLRNLPPVPLFCSTKDSPIENNCRIDSVNNNINSRVNSSVNNNINSSINSSVNNNNNINNSVNSSINNNINLFDILGFNQRIFFYELSYISSKLKPLSNDFIREINELEKKAISIQ